MGVKVNNKALNIIRNFSYTIISNFISLVATSLVILVIPKIIGVEEYGYWQLYLFYSTYVGFMHLGWNDGIYLRYGGKKYEELNRPLFFSQFWMLVILQLIIFILILLFSSFLTLDGNRNFIIISTLICMVLVNVRRFLQYILQGTNRIKTFAKITIMDRIMYICLIFIFLNLSLKKYELLIIADLIGKLVSLGYAAFSCKDIVFQKVTVFRFSFLEMFNNIRVGIKIMLSNIASILIIGIVRFGIERSWGVATFGKVSLTLSISNLLMIFINAMGIVVYPVLRRTDEKKLSTIYILIRNLLTVLLMGLLILNFPLEYILSIWLPEYADSLKYLAMIFPMVVFEGKMVLLINNYLKTFRQEKFILKVNLITLSLSIISTIITTFLIKSLDLAVLSIVALLCFRAVFAEIYLSKILRISIKQDIIIEIILTIIFISVAWNFIASIALVIYLAFYGLYLMFKRKDIAKTITDLKLLIKK